MLIIIAFIVGFVIKDFSHLLYLVLRKKVKGDDNA